MVFQRRRRSRLPPRRRRFFFQRLLQQQQPRQLRADPSVMPARGVVKSGGVLMGSSLPVVHAVTRGWFQKAPSPRWRAPSPTPTSSSPRSRQTVNCTLNPRRPVPSRWPSAAWFSRPRRLCITPTPGTPERRVLYKARDGVAPFHRRVCQDHGGGRHGTKRRRRERANVPFSKPAPVTLGLATDAGADGDTCRRVRVTRLLNTGRCTAPCSSGAR